jgi:hypothetical protein
MLLKDSDNLEHTVCSWITLRTKHAVYALARFSEFLSYSFECYRSIDIIPKQTVLVKIEEVGILLYEVFFDIEFYFFVICSTEL